MPFVLVVMVSAVSLHVTQLVDGFCSVYIRFVSAPLRVIRKPVTSEIIDRVGWSTGGGSGGGPEDAVARYTMNVVSAGTETLTTVFELPCGMVTSRTRLQA